MQMRFLAPTVLAAVVANACSAASQPIASSLVDYEPPQSATVFVLSPSIALPTRIAQVKKVVAESASPGMVLIVAVAGDDESSDIYVIKPGDSLYSIARAHGIDLATLEAHNVQFGPLNGRAFQLIYPGEIVYIPGPGKGTRNLLVARAPAGPMVPKLTVLAPLGDDPTDFQRVRWEKQKAATDKANWKAIATWKAAATKQMDPWHAQIAQKLDALANGPLDTMIADAKSKPSLISAIREGAATLHDLTGRRVLVLMEPGTTTPSDTELALSTMDGIDFVVANLDASDLDAAWRSAGNAGHASVTVLTSASTELRLAALIKSQ